MLSPPDDLAEEELRSTIATGWGRDIASTCYRPLGFGSHHWEAVDGGGARWFVTVDELETKRHSRRESLDSAFARLRAALGAASALRDTGAAFAVAPLPTLGGAPVMRAGDRFAVALYPYVDGQGFEWGEFATPEHRRAVLDMVVAVHSAPAGVRRVATADDFAVPHRDELEAALAGDMADCGPYARPTAALLAEHGAGVRRLLDRYDDLVDRAPASVAVLTHGEPHPGNTMLTADGWRLVDWDTALLAPPERDLWSLDPGDGSVFDAYTEATGVTPRPAMLELYRVRWDVADLAVDVGRFRRHHTGSANDDESWRILSALVVNAGETRMTRFSDPVAKVLRKAGWRPGRAVPDEQLSAWADQLAGFEMSESARRVLREFGGLSVDQRGPGETCARERFELDPLLALHEQDRFELFADSHGLRLYPVGEAAGGHYFLAVGPEGGTYLVMDDVQLVGRTFDEALEALIRGRRPTPLG